MNPLAERHIDRLEEEAVFSLRGVAAWCERPAVLASNVEKAFKQFVAAPRVVDQAGDRAGDPLLVQALT